MDFHILSYILCLYCLSFSASFGLWLSAAALIMLTMYDFVFLLSFLLLLGQGSQSPHRYITRKPDKHRAVASSIRICNGHVDSAPNDILLIGLDTLLLDSSISPNEFRLRNNMKAFYSSSFFFNL